MQTMTRSYRSLSLIWEMHGDKVVMAVAIAAGLAFSAAVTAFFVPVA